MPTTEKTLPAKTPPIFDTSTFIAPYRDTKPLWVAHDKFRILRTCTFDNVEAQKMTHNAGVVLLCHYCPIAVDILKLGNRLCKCNTEPAFSFPCDERDFFMQFLSTKGFCPPGGRTSL